MKETENPTSQKGRVMVVTGANTGLGFETALALAKTQATVVMACRNRSKARAARDKILQQQPDAAVEVMEIDLSSLESVRRFADEFNEKYNKLDVLINNAGVMMPPYSKTEDGFELQFGANYLGHFLLTGLLLPKLLATPNSRIVSLSSIAHKSGTINFNDLQSEQKYTASVAYSQSKLACLMFAFELQRRLEKIENHSTISVAAHPGVAETELVRHMPKWLYLFMKYTLAPFVIHSAANGAKPTLMAAIGQAEAGAYYGPTGFREMKGKPGKATYTDLAKDKEVAKRLWEVSEDLVGQKVLN